MTPLFSRRVGGTALDLCVQSGVRPLPLVITLAALLACNPPPPAPSAGPVASVGPDPATPMASTASGPALSSAPIASSPPASSAAPGSAASTRKPTTTFIYEQDGDTLSFFRPRTLRLVRHADGGTRVCQTELSQSQDNMWTADNLEAALRDPDVVSALAAHASNTALDAGRLSAGRGSITWQSRCTGCTPEKPGVERLHQMLRGVMMNRRLLCP